MQRQAEGCKFHIADSTYNDPWALFAPLRGAFIISRLHDVVDWERIKMANRYQWFYNEKLLAANHILILKR
jgi:hypothetical protein